MRDLTRSIVVAGATGAVAFACSFTTSGAGGPGAEPEVLLEGGVFDGAVPAANGTSSGPSGASPSIDGSPEPDGAPPGAAGPDVGAD
jgi:hypothetical protein